MIVAPCKDCTDRYLMCHSSCERYKNWKDEVDDIKEKAIKHRATEKMLDERRNKAIQRMHHSSK